MASDFGPSGPSSSLGGIERPGSPKDFPGPFQAVGLTVALGFLMVVIGSGLSLVCGSEAMPEILGANALAGAIVLGWGWTRMGPAARATFRFRAFSPGLLLPMSVFLLGASIVLSDFDNVVRSAWPMPPEFEELFRQLLAGGFLSFLLLVIEAPLVEELVFRGLILRGLIARQGVRRAIVLQAILFAALHLNPWQFVPAFFIGLFLGWLFLKTGSLGACILFHAAWNGLSFFLGAYAEGLGVVVPGYTGDPFGPPVFQPPMFLALGLALCAAGWFWLRFACESRAKTLG